MIEFILIASLFNLGELVPPENPEKIKVVTPHESDSKKSCSSCHKDPRTPKKDGKRVTIFPNIEPFKEFIK